MGVGRIWKERTPITEVAQSVSYLERSLQALLSTKQLLLSLKGPSTFSEIAGTWHPLYAILEVRECTTYWQIGQRLPWLRSSFSSFGFFLSHRRCRFIREGAFVHEVNTFQIVSIVYLAEGLDKYKSRVSSRLEPLKSAGWHASMTEWARHSPSRNRNHKRRGALALSQDLIYQWKAS